MTEGQISLWEQVAHNEAQIHDLHEQRHILKNRLLVFVGVAAALATFFAMTLTAAWQFRADLMVPETTYHPYQLGFLLAGLVLIGFWLWQVLSLCLEIFSRRVSAGRLLAVHKAILAGVNAER